MTGFLRSLALRGAGVNPTWPVAEPDLPVRRAPEDETGEGAGPEPRQTSPGAVAHPGGSAGGSTRTESTRTDGQPAGDSPAASPRPRRDRLGTPRPDLGSDPGEDGRTAAVSTGQREAGTSPDQQPRPPEAPVAPPAPAGLVPRGDGPREAGQPTGAEPRTPANLLLRRDSTGDVGQPVGAEPPGHPEGPRIHLLPQRPPATPKSPARDGSEPRKQQPAGAPGGAPGITVHIGSIEVVGEPADEGFENHASAAPPLPGADFSAMEFGRRYFNRRWL